MPTKEYQREWRKKNPNKSKEYWIIYKKKHSQEILEKDRIRDRIRNKDPKRKEYKKKYLKKYANPYYHKKIKINPELLNKKIIRMRSQRKYGKVPNGFERHHLNYDSEDNFILVKKEEHRPLFHRK